MIGLLDECSGIRLPDLATELGDFIFPPAQFLSSGICIVLNGKDQESLKQYSQSPLPAPSLSPKFSPIVGSLLGKLIPGFQVWRKATLGSSYHNVCRRGIFPCPFLPLFVFNIETSFHFTYGLSSRPF